MRKYVFYDSPNVGQLVPFMMVDSVRGGEETCEDVYKKYVKNHGIEVGFEYVDITLKGCEGWLNLFFKDAIIALIRDVDMAKEIRKVANERKIS